MIKSTENVKYKHTGTNRLYHVHPLTLVPECQLLTVSRQICQNKVSTMCDEDVEATKFLGHLHRWLTLLCDVTMMQFICCNHGRLDKPNFYELS
jgi:hypothetical protein